MPISDPPTDLEAPPQPKNCSCRNPPGRNIVICMDGTLNQFNEKNSNVVELYSLLVKDENQLTYYNSGIGTYVKDSTGLNSWFSLGSWSQWISQTTDIMVAWNFKARILDAYQWLAENYVDGDRIFLFGFSRGAYQVRVIAGMLHRVGLLHKGNNQQIPFAYELYMKSSNEKRCNNFKEVFSRPNVKAHFIGAWDTVSSIGFFRGIRLPETSHGMKHVCGFRHALALDERRVKFLPEYANDGAAPDSEREDIKEVWFSGSHSDIGGGNILNESSNLFGPAMRWMTYEAAYFGLRMRPHKGEWDTIPLTLSMGKFWRIVEVIPFLTPSTSYKSRSRLKKWAPHFAAPRQILKNQLIHSSVLKEIKNSGIKPAARLPTDDINWDKGKLEKEKMLERDWYHEVDDVLPRIYEAAKLKIELPSGDVHAFLTLASSEVGRYSIISQPGAINVINAIFLAKYGPTNKLEQNSDSILLQALIKLLAEFKTSRNRPAVDPDKFLAESQKDMNMQVQHMNQLIRNLMNDINTERSFIVYIAPENTKLKSRIERLGYGPLTDEISKAHIAISSEERQQLGFKAVDKDLEDKGVNFKLRLLDDTAEELALVMRRLSHFYTHLKDPRNILNESIDMDKISVSLFQVRDTFVGHPRVIKHEDARNLCENGVIDITVDEDYESIYGFEVLNNNENGEPLFPVLLYFDYMDFTISQHFPPTVAGSKNSHGLPEGESITIGYGDGWGSTVPPFYFYVAPEYDMEVGFFKLFLFKEAATLDSIVQETPIFSRMARGRTHTTNLSRLDEIPQAQGSITITVIQRKSR